MVRGELFTEDGPSSVPRMVRAGLPSILIWQFEDPPHITLASEVTWPIRAVPHLIAAPKTSCILCTQLSVLALKRHDEVSTVSAGSAALRFG